MNSKTRQIEEDYEGTLVAKKVKIAQTRYHSYPLAVRADVFAEMLMMGMYSPLVIIKASFQMRHPTPLPLSQTHHILIINS